MVTLDKAAEAGQYLTFFMAGEEYAVKIVKVREIMEYPSVTPVPLTPPWIMGVLNVRGNVVPVVDLGVKFGIGVREITARTCIVIVDADLDGTHSVMGIIADQVSAVMDFKEGDVEPAPDFGGKVDVDYLAGMAKTAEGFALMLDIDAVLSADEILELAEIAKPETIEG
ncbi:MAG: chemotaxis protein CheW [Gemmatimonadota bacterium]|nr:chemotaxis protein CheW [Gemmatimonadota bacterium]